jgi:HTH-type transcriptional regulator/antitoxin HipB
LTISWFYSLIAIHLGEVDLKEIAMGTKATSPTSLGLIVRDARTKKGLSQTAAGKSVGIDQPTLSKIERGESNARIDTLFRLLAALDMEIILRPRNKASDQHEGDNW